MKREVVVDIADMAVSDHPDDVLVTYSLGSCLGITVYDPELKVGGMVHCMLPISNLYGNKHADKPCMFVDTGIMSLLKALFEKGVRKSRAVVKVVGGSDVLKVKGQMFRIGERNLAVLRKIMWKNNMLIAASEVGGSVSRTLRLDIDTGRVIIKTGGKAHEL